jgi:hypothetical protein
LVVTVLLVVVGPVHLVGWFSWKMTLLLRAKKLLLCRKGFRALFTSSGRHDCHICSSYLPMKTMLLQTNMSGLIS